MNIDLKNKAIRTMEGLRSNHKRVLSNDPVKDQSKIKERVRASGKDKSMFREILNSI